MIVIVAQGYTDEIHFSLCISSWQRHFLGNGLNPVPITVFQELRMKGTKQFNTFVLSHILK